MFLTRSDDGQYTVHADTSHAAPAAADTLPSLPNVVWVRGAKAAHATVNGTRLCPWHIAKPMAPIAPEGLGEDGWPYGVTCDYCRDRLLGRVPHRYPSSGAAAYPESAPPPRTSVPRIPVDPTSPPDEPTLRRLRGAARLAGDDAAVAEYSRALYRHYVAPRSEAEYLARLDASTRRA